MPNNTHLVIRLVIGISQLYHSEIGMIEFSLKLNEHWIIETYMETREYYRQNMLFSDCYILFWTIGDKSIN